MKYSTETLIVTQTQISTSIATIPIPVTTVGVSLPGTRIKTVAPPGSTNGSTQNNSGPSLTSTPEVSNAQPSIFSSVGPAVTSSDMTTTLPPSPIQTATLSTVLFTTVQTVTYISVIKISKKGPPAIPTTPPLGPGMSKSTSRSHSNNIHTLPAPTSHSQQYSSSSTSGAPTHHSTSTASQSGLDSPVPEAGGTLETNQKLARILPAVLLPLFLTLVLTLFAFRQWRRSRQHTLETSAVPFIIPPYKDRQLHRHHQDSIQIRSTRLPPFLPQNQGDAPSRTNGERNNIVDVERNARASNLIVAVDSDSRLVPPLASTELESTTANNASVMAHLGARPTTQVEITDLAHLRARLANIEARIITVPPPDYYSNGREHQTN